MKYEKGVVEYVRRKCEDGVSLENINDIISCIYINHPLGGPYLSLRQGGHGSKAACEDHRGRGLYQVNFDGEYGYAGTVFTMQGSPMRGLVMVTEFMVIYERLFRSNKPIHVDKCAAVSYYGNDLKKLVAKYFFEFYAIEKEKMHGRKLEPVYRWKKDTEADKGPVVCSPN
jgi:hypothetical protein